MNLQKFKEKRGITLIALVVTIIVLLILAGISISMLTGQNGILNRAKEAKESTQQAQEDEQTAINNTSNFINSYVNGKSYEVVEPTNVEDWDFTTESDGTITITKYKGSDTEVVIPNYINGVKVKKLKKVGGYSIWSDNILNVNGAFNIGSAYRKGQNTIGKVTEMGPRVFDRIPSITVTVPYKLGESLPSGWNSTWNETNSDCEVKIKYQQ